MYGIDENEPTEIKKALKKYNKDNIKLQFGEFEFFKQYDYDVLIIKILSHDLHKLHNLINDNVKCSGNEYPDYNPHCTLAYIEKDSITNNDIKSWDKFNDIIITKSVDFSSKDEKYIKISLSNLKEKCLPQYQKIYNSDYQLNLGLIESKLNKLKIIELSNLSINNSIINKDLYKVKKRSIIDEKLENLNEAGAAVRKKRAENTKAEIEAKNQKKQNQSNDQLNDDDINQFLNKNNNPQQEDPQEVASNTTSSFERNSALFLDQQKPPFVELFNNISILMTFNGKNWEIVSRRFLKTIDQTWAMCINKIMTREKRGRPSKVQTSSKSPIKEVSQVPFIGDSPLIGGIQNMTTSLVAPIWNAIKSILADIWEGIKNGILARSNLKEAKKTIQILNEYKDKVNEIFKNNEIEKVFDNFLTSAIDFYNQYPMVEKEGQLTYLEHMVNARKKEIIDTVAQWIDQIDIIINDLNEKYIDLKRKTKYQTNFRFGSEKSTRGGLGSPEETQ